MSAAQKHHEVPTEIEEPKQPLKLSVHANALRLEGIRRRITEAVDYELKYAGFFGYDEMGAQTLLRDVLLEQHNRVDDLVFPQEVAKARNAGKNGGPVSEVGSIRHFSYYNPLTLISLKTTNEVILQYNCRFAPWSVSNIPYFDTRS
jgi:hypothetical protein